MREGIDEKIKPLISIKGADEADDLFACKIPRFSITRIGSASLEVVGIDAVVYDHQFFCWDASFYQIVLESLTEDANLVGVPAYEGFERPGKLVFPGAFCICAMVNRSVFPEGSDFIDNRDPEFTAHPKGRDGIKNR